MTETERNMLSLWPRTGDQQRNRARHATIEKVATELTGDDWQRYNRIVDAIENQNHSAFVEEVLQ